MRAAAFLTLVLVLLLATWKGPHAKAPAIDSTSLTVSLSERAPTR